MAPTRSWSASRACCAGRDVGIYYKTKDEIKVMRDANRIVAMVLDELVKHVAPGVSTLDLDKVAEETTLRLGAKPAFKGYRVGDLTYHHSLCASPNEVVVHGIPSAKRVLK